MFSVLLNKSWARENALVKEQESKITIKVAAIDWCPQLCVDELFSGYINEIINEVYSDKRYFLKVDYLPWSRAIRALRQGDYDALLSPAKDEAPDLIFPKNAIGTQQMCFFTLKGNPWNYQDEDSLAGLNIGVARDTSVEELNVYMEKNQERFQF